MTIRNLLSRRTFLGSAGVLAGIMLNARRVFGLPRVASSSSGMLEKPIGFGSTGNVFEELGVTTVINGQGTMTVLGGSLVGPEVEGVMALASQRFVSIVELERAAGKRKLTTISGLC